MAKQAPEGGIQYFSLDSTAWARPQAHTLTDRQYVYQPSRINQGSVVVIGYKYSLLDWVPEASGSWSLLVDVERIPSEKTDLEMGVEQVKRLCQSRGPRDDGLDIVMADAKYGNHHFMEALKDQPCPKIPGWYGKVVRLRKDRVLYRPVPERRPGKRGRPRKHGSRFAFNEVETWGDPAEFVSLQHPRWGSVQIRRWNGLHARESVDIEFDVVPVQVRVHLEKSEPPAPLWLAWLAPPAMPNGVVVDAETIWRAYQHRWTIEPSIRFRKQRLWWTLPQFQRVEASDRWSVLVSLAM